MAQIHTDFLRNLDDHFPDELAALYAGVHQVALSPVPSYKSSDWTYEPTQRERSLSQDFLVSDNSTATSMFATVSTISDEFEESQRALEYDAEESDKCPVPGCAKDVHHGKPCEPKTPPSQVMPEPEAPPPIKRRRTSIMVPLDSKFKGKRLSFDFSDGEGVSITPYQPNDPLNTAFFSDSE